VRFSLVRSVGAADKEFVEESGFKPNQNSGWFKFLRELSIRKKGAWASIELFEEEDWFEQTKKINKKNNVLYALYELFWYILSIILLIYYKLLSVNVVIHGLYKFIYSSIDCRVGYMRLFLILKSMPKSV